jgi:DNA-binding transcriptional LysR family regulator
LRRHLSFLKLMDWDDLKHFLAVARSGSLTEAARELKTSAATVGRRIAALETKLGARLFDRQQTGYTLTESGEAIRLKAEDVEGGILAVEREALGRDSRVVGKVRVATTGDIATLVIAPQLPNFRTRFPGLVLEIVASPEVVNLTRRDADVALRTVRPMQGDFVVRRVGSWNCALYARRSYADTRGLKAGTTDLSKAEIITWNEESAHLRGGPWFSEHAALSAIAFTANQRRIHHAACKAGLGVAILPCLAADRDSDLVCLVPAERVISVDLWLVVHRDLVRTPRVRVVMDFLAEAAAQSSE